MIRVAEPDDWLLVQHRDHAGLAGVFARHWGNRDFAPPEPFADILVAVCRHDDAWVARDSEPLVTREGRPAAFSRELVGSYSAFEEIDLEEYLKVRGRATESVASDNGYAAILVSMHTVNLLTEQADLRGLAEAKLALHRQFVERQIERQRELIAATTTADETRAPDVSVDTLRRAFEFLQVCDSLSLIACVRYSDPIALRHKHRDRGGVAHTLQCQPLGNDRYRVTPFPFQADEIAFSVPCRRIAGSRFTSHRELQSAYAAAPTEMIRGWIVR